VHGMSLRRPAPRAPFDENQRPVAGPPSGAAAPPSEPGSSTDLTFDDENFNTCFFPPSNFRGHGGELSEREREEEMAAAKAIAKNMTLVGLSELACTPAPQGMSGAMAKDLGFGEFGSMAPPASQSSSAFTDATFSTGAASCGGSSTRKTSPLVPSADNESGGVCTSTGPRDAVLPLVKEKTKVLRSSTLQPLDKKSRVDVDAAAREKGGASSHAQPSFGGSGSAAQHALLHPPPPFASTHMSFSSSFSSTSLPSAHSTAAVCDLNMVLGGATSYEHPADHPSSPSTGHEQPSLIDVCASV